MTFLTKMENTYLAILRVTILLIASLTLLATLVMTATSLPAFLSTPQKEEITVDKSEYPKLDGYLQESKKFTAALDGNAASNQEVTDDNSVMQYSASKKEAAKALKNYVVSIVDGATITEDLILKDIFTKTDDGIAEEYHDNYYQSLTVMITDLLKKSKEQKTVYERHYSYDDAQRDKDFIDVFALIDWHHKKFIESIDAKNAEQEKIIAEAELKKSEAKQSVLFAAGCFGVFVFFVFLFIIIKIERNLRVIADRPTGSGNI